ncbi:hypothetical protein, partial [Candidatus Bandiella numerosa]|uniref:hypothetical protein n=1 Tax=Candidatus Bandiella numerosa TaxID=2570586 RepID=UPI001F309DA7
ILPRLFLFFLLLFQNPFDTCIVLGQRLALFLFIRYLIFMLPLSYVLIFSFYHICFFLPIMQWS